MKTLFLFFILLISITEAQESMENFANNYQVIFLPEEHTNKEDHNFQLDIIKLLSSKNYKFIIAMEMFQQPFQDALDLYVTGQISEEEMLRRTDYRRRWGFDPSLYRDIWSFAKDRGIRIVAINISSELLQRIRKEGIEKVRDESLPYPVIPQTEKEIKELREFLKTHPKVDEKSFFDVQNAWDNGMALAIARLLDKYPDYKIVVLVGRGHAQDYESGIPRRLRMLKPDVRMRILRREEFQRALLFSTDFSKESSSASSMREPNCRP
ncbi:ChaN family lipoprotein [Pampinifervens florentissimum]|uniref:ChaN family lipoprotein n=1 Tax=Pampinifervens florentissimum TaxID=1632019 RepID=UPI0013B47CD1|nr:ChaN family lipoprotein [Hydrogenobacter sp. T-8]QID33365.1 ChaN family lipoprotein [Hydrogenobacter sp. T-8]